MTPGERYLKALAARTPPRQDVQAARSFAEIEDGTHYRPAGRVDNLLTSFTDIYGKTVRAATQGR